MNKKSLDLHFLMRRGLNSEKANHLLLELNSITSKENSPAHIWKTIVAKNVLRHAPFELHRSLFQWVYSDWNADTEGPPPAWFPDPEEVKKTNLYRLMKELGFTSYPKLHAWSTKHREKFWHLMIRALQISFMKPYTQLLDVSKGITHPQWLVGSQLNIVESCFRADASLPAIIYQPEGGDIQTISTGELQTLTHQVAFALDKHGFKKGDAIAVNMPMTYQSVAIYLGIIQVGGVVVSIADSFAPEEIQTRLRIAKAKAIFTQDFILRGGKKLPLYSKVVAAQAPQVIVLPCEDKMAVELRSGDVSWNAFLSVAKNQTPLPVTPCHPHDHSNILFSSGTTGDPKAIPWTHTTPIKCAADGYLHHDIQSGDVVAWPTNLGWMMGPWLIYASLINRATIALYYGAPTSREFGVFVQNAKVTMLGLVPSIVKVWKISDCMSGLDWTHIKAFSSTGECSNADDYFFLMSLAQYRPVIEYCGGTEIGGGFLTGTLLQPASPATFSTPAMGLDIEILDEEGTATQNGEMFVVPPSIGLSTELLNQDHDEVYFNHTPVSSDGTPLRRHGDQMERLPHGYIRAHGRADDTMNLGGIKVSSAEIERVLNKVPGISETAAIAVPPVGGGPSLLVIFTVLTNKESQKTNELKPLLQKTLSEKLNPLFKIYDVVLIESLPRTASNKVMRRVLRSGYKRVSPC